MPRLRQSPDFRKLQTEWYKKLKDSGFRDIEDKSGMVQSYAGEIVRTYTADQYAHKQRYYELAGQLLHDHPWPSTRDRKIWELHAEGLQFREIAHKLRLSKETVKRMVWKYAEYIKA